MSDEHLRGLERAATSGAVDDEARLLIERLRAGQLPLERLQLLAHMGLPAAVTALGGDLLCACGHTRNKHTRSYPPPTAQEAYSTTACTECSACSEFDTTDLDTGDLEWWAGQLPNWGREICVRIALAASSAALEAWRGSSDWPMITCESCDGRGKTSCGRCGSYDCRGACSKCDGKGEIPDPLPPAILALNAAREWLDIPGDYEEGEAMRASSRAGKEWAALTAMLCYRNMKEDTVVDVIHHAVEDSSEQAVREAIKKLASTLK